MDEARTHIPLAIERCGNCGTRVIVFNGRVNFDITRTPCVACVNEFQLPSQLLKMHQ